jgi:hypothetical protein
MAEGTVEDIDEKEEEEAIDEEVDEEEEEVDEEEEAPVRKSAAYFVGLRQGKKQAKKEAEEKEEEEEGGELTAPAKKALQKELSPVVNALKKQADDVELREYFAENPNDKKFEKAIKRRMETWTNVPVSEIAKTVKFGTEQKERGEKKEKVEQEVRGRSLRGSSARAEEVKLPSTPEEFAAIYKDVKKGKTVKLGGE